MTTRDQIKKLLMDDGLTEEDAEELIEDALIFLEEESNLTFVTKEILGLETCWEPEVQQLWNEYIHPSRSEGTEEIPDEDTF